jgi:CRP-like cAMP-binding protein
MGNPDRFDAGQMDPRAEVHSGVVHCTATTNSRPATAASGDARFIEGVIANLDIFRGLASQQVGRVARQCWVMSARRGSVIAQHGARLPGILALAYGSVQLLLGAAGEQTRVIRLVSPGETFGKAAAFLGRESSYAALALADCKLVVIPCAAVSGLMECDGNFARSMVVALARSNARLLAELEAATLQRSKQRLAGYLDSLADGKPGACTVQLPVSKTVVAARLGVKKETLSRLLRELADEGVIAVAQRKIAILDGVRLAQVARSR